MTSWWVTLWESGATSPEGKVVQLPEGESPLSAKNWTRVKDEVLGVKGRRAAPVFAGMVPDEQRVSLPEPAKVTPARPVGHTRPSGRVCNVDAACGCSVRWNSGTQRWECEIGHPQNSAVGK